MKNTGESIGLFIGSIGLLIGGIVVLIVGIFLTSAGVDQWMNARNAKQNYEQATAVVTGNERHAYYGNYNEQGIQYYYCAEFKFQTKEGQTISVKQADSTDLPCSGSVSDSPDYQIGQQVPIYYDPHDPAHTMLAEDVNGGHVIGVSLGAIILIVGISMIVGSLVPFVINLVRRMRNTELRDKDDNELTPEQKRIDDAKKKRTKGGKALRVIGGIIAVVGILLLLLLIIGWVVGGGDTTTEDYITTIIVCPTPLIVLGAGLFVWGVSIQSKLTEVS